MDALATTYPDAAVTYDPALEREFEQRLADSSTLAFRVAYGVLRNREDAEEIAQEAFLRAYRSFTRLRDRERFRAWLARIAWRLALDRIRSSKRREIREKVVSEIEAPARTVEDLAASSEFQRHLEAALDELPEKFRVVLVMGAIEGHKIEDMARVLELPTGTVKSRLHFGKKMLAEKLRWLVTTTKNA